MTKVDRKIEDFFVQFPKTSYKENEVLLAPGKQPTKLIYLATGSIKQYDIAANGSLVVVNVFKAGSFLPMSWLLNDETNRWFYEARQACTVHLADKPLALEFIQTNNDVMMSFIKRLCSGASGQQRRTAHLMAGTANTRVLYELIVQFQRFGTSLSNGLVLTISESKLAELTGLSREAVSRSLTFYKEEGLLERRYNQIDIQSIEDLENKLGYNV